MTNTEQVARLRALASECAAPHGLTVQDITFAPAGKRRALTLVLDSDIADLPADDTTSPVAPVDLEAVAEVAREFGARLDESDVMGAQPYTLEVSSPGIGRRLERIEQFRRNVGRKVRLVWRQAAGDVPAGTTRSKDGTVEALGLLREVAPQQITLSPDPVRATKGAKPKVVPDVTVSFNDISHGAVEVDFSTDEEDI